MLSNDELKQKISVEPDVDYVDVSGDGHHYTITVVSDTFVGKRNVSRQQWVYGLINDWISSGSLHAITMNTFTTQEWEAHNG